MPFLTGYGKRIACTINSDGVGLTGDLVDQTVVVHAASSLTGFWDDAPVAGTSVRFTSSDGETLLKFQVESYDTTGDDAWWHVKIPTLDADADTVIYLYFDPDTPSDGSDKENTWESGYNAVLHLNQDQAEGALDDATSNNNDGTNQGSTSAAGKVDLGRGFDGVDDYINFGNGAGLNFTAAQPFTIEAWISPDDFDTGAYFLVKAHDSGNVMNYSLFVATSETVLFQIRDGVSNTVFRRTTTTIPALAFTHVVSVFDPAQSGASRIKIYVNGVAETSYAAEGSTGTIGSLVTTQGMWVGKRQGASPLPYDGDVDEVTVSPAVRTADWVRARYQSGLGTWLSFGAVETPTVSFVPKIIVIS